ncbi:glycosyltransferase [Cytophaga aurantiaca]|uniref:glycosyltransferase n=1 Tax=Cytophaga aurantiaca TaxID=29530 RepID=UPI00037B3950|nr:glycosyltransferase [Cytophaga aurantiaca]
MRIIVLNTNSFGGNYEYSRCIANEYIKHKDVSSCVVLVPENASNKEDEIFKKVLISDVLKIKSVLLRKGYFIYRSIINPLKVYRYLKNQPASVVLFNDYEQITSIFWTPLFKGLKKKHVFAVILHDPDRDNYLPFKWLSEYTMHKVMRIMDIAFYHKYLPDKKYYAFNIPKIDIPHGLYIHETFDHELHNLLVQKKGSSQLMGVIGNIRDEKNYTLLIDSLLDLPQMILVIAGNPSNSDVSIDVYKKQIEQLGLEDQVIWIEKRLSDDEIQSVIIACDLILLYYKHSFTSQSGILNLIAPHKKKLIVSDGTSALTRTVEKFKIGEVVPMNKEAFVGSVLNVLDLNNKDAHIAMWDEYLEYASWKSNVDTVLKHVNSLSDKNDTV